MAEVGKESDARAAATIGGAPISWVAIIGALLGAGTMVPIVYYIEGGGYHSLAKAMYVPVVAILGPVGGIVSIMIGGLIALFIAPGAVGGPNFPTSLAFDYLMLSILIGLMINGKWKTMIPFWVGGVFFYIFIPWIIPGQVFVESFGIVGPYDFWPLFIAANWYDLSSIILVIIFGTKVPKWLRSDNRKSMVAAILITVWATEISHLYGWGIWALVVSSPAELIAILSAVAVPLERTVYSTVGALIGVPLLVALRKSGLRSIANTAW